MLLSASINQSSQRGLSKLYYVTYSKFELQIFIVEALWAMTRLVLS